MTARLLRAAAALAVLCFVAGAGIASAGQDPEALPPGTVVLGPIQIRPSLVLKDMGVDNNVKNEAVNPIRDYTFTLAPGADVRFRMRRLRLGYLTSSEYVYFQKTRSERGSNTSSAARFEFDLGRLKPFGSISGLNTRARLNAEVDARARHHDLSYSTGVTFKLASRTNVQVNGSQTTVAFAPDATFRGTDLRQSFDGRRRNGDVSLAIQLTPITTLSLAGSREQQRFERAPDRNSNGWRLTSGVTFNPSGVLTGGASVGYRRFDPVSPTLPGYSGLVANVSTTATIYGRHYVQVGFSRDVQYSYDEGNVYFLGTGGTVTWTWSLVGPIDIRATGAHYLMDYGHSSSSTSHDTTTMYGGGVGYRFSNRARLGANAEWSRRDSSRDVERGYRNQRMFVGLTWGTQ